MKIRVGFGFDVHQLVAGRELWLGGIRLEHEKGLLGHSDADVLIHTICDALLGAANMRDICTLLWIALESRYRLLLGRSQEHPHFQRNNHRRYFRSQTQLHQLRPCQEPWL